MKLKSKKGNTPTKVIGVSKKLKKEFNDNFYLLQGSTVITMLAIKHSEDTTLITKLFDWLLGSFNALPTCLNYQDHSLMFSFMQGFTKDEQMYRQMKLKIIHALKENNYDKTKIDWFMQDLDLQKKDL